MQLSVIFRFSKKKKKICIYLYVYSYQIICIVFKSIPNFGEMVLNTFSLTSREINY